MSPETAARLFTSNTAPETSFRRRQLPTPHGNARRSVLDVSEFFGETSGGVRTYLKEKARYVESSRDLRQSILVPGPWDAITESERVRCYWLGSRRIPGQAPYRFMLDVPASRRILASERPDVVEVGSPGFAPWHVAATARRLGIPIVSFFHSHVPRIVAGTPQSSTMLRLAGESLAWRYLRRLDRMYARTIVSSRCAAAELHAAGIHRTSYVPLGVDLEMFRPARRSSRDLLSAQLDIGNRPIVAFVGRIAREKRLDLVLNSWPTIARRTGAVLLLVGDGPMRPDLQERFSHDDVRWLGYEGERTRVADLLASADVVIAPGDAETFGLATLEALASGTPVLSANIGGSAELVKDSRCGGLFTSGDELSFASELEVLLAADRDILAARGRAHAERHHAWPSVFASIFRVYDDVIERPS